LPTDQESTFNSYSSHNN